MGPLRHNAAASFSRRAFSTRDSAKDSVVVCARILKNGPSYFDLALISGDYFRKLAFK